MFAGRIKTHPFITRSLKLTTVKTIKWVLDYRIHLITMSPAMFTSSILEYKEIGHLKWTWL